jgi:hypothetical protein
LEGLLFSEKTVRRGEWRGSKLGGRDWEKRQEGNCNLKINPINQKLKKKKKKGGRKEKRKRKKSIDFFYVIAIFYISKVLMYSIFTL